MKTYLKDLTPEEVIRRLKAGEVVNFEEHNTKIKMVEGILSSVFQDGTIRINISLDLFDERCYFEEPEELKIEVGKFYRTRDGSKAFIYQYDGFNFHGVIIDSPNFFEWFKNGTYNYNGKESPLDLISEWGNDDVAED